MKNIIIFIAVILTSIFLIIPVYGAGPWKGRIVDIETKEPIEGAVVVAVWYRVWRTPAGGVSEYYEIQEILTDKEGDFEMPSYIPINLLPILSYIKGPEFIIFKPGYRSLSGRHLEENIIDNPSEFDREGIMYKLSPGLIELPKLKTREERLKASMIGLTDYTAKELPLLYNALKEEDQYLSPPAVRRKQQ